MKQVLLTDEELHALVNLIDAGVKHTGIAMVKNAAYLLGKLEAAEEVKPELTEVKKKA
jgi:hypothetical protein